MDSVQGLVVAVIFIAAFLYLGREFLHYIARLSSSGGTGCRSCGCGPQQASEKSDNKSC